MTPRLLSRVAAAVTLVCLPALFAAPAPAQSAEAFRTGLRKVRHLVNNGNGKKSLALLEKLLDTNKRKPYVRARRQEVFILHRRASFRAMLKRPAPATVVSGKLEKYNKRSGKLRIRYTPRQLKGDFTKSGRSVWVHTGSFTGPYTITMKGDDFPRTQLMFLLCMVDLKTPMARCTFTLGKSGGEATVSHFAPRTRPHFTREAGVPPCKGRWTARIKVTKSKIILHVNGRQVISTSSVDGQFGYWCFEELKFSSLTIEGPMEPSWIQGKADAALDKQRKTFAKSYKPNRALPRWLRINPPVATDEPEWPTFPVTLSDSDSKRYGRLRHQILKADPETAAMKVEVLQGSDADPLVKAWLAAVHHEHVEQPGAALKHLDAVLRGNPDFNLGLEMRAEVLTALGKHRRAEADWRKLIERAPGREATYKSLARTLLACGQAEEALIALDDAFGKVSSPDQLEMTRALALKRIYGPDWTRMFEYKTSNYHVLSDIDQKTCYEAARILEGGYRQYRVHLKWVKHAKAGRFRVFLFSGQDGYLNYTKDVLGVSPARSAGLYSPFLKQLLIWNVPERESMMRTVRHEGFHQYLDRVMANPPTWLNEGLAEYYETADVHNGRWTTGKVRHDHVDRLRTNRPTLSYLISMPRRDFYGRHALRNYGHAWAFVHFLLHGPKENQKLFERIFKALLAGGDDADVKKILDGNMLQALEPRFKRYLLEL